MVYVNLVAATALWVAAIFYPTMSGWKGMFYRFLLGGNVAVWAYICLLK
jgi:hypothetical protein